MGGKYPQEFIDSVVAKVDIVSVIDARVPLKKAGREYRACCPFHSEKTPSFYVSPQKQFFHCFGCGAHGTAIGFLMQYDRMSFEEALIELASDAGLPLPNVKSGGGLTTKTIATSPELSPYELLLKAANFYRAQLKRHPERELAVTYLKGRGLTGEIAAEYEIGLAPSGWQNIESHFGASESLKAALLSVGLLKKNDSGHTYDFFRSRIMFPIRDRRGRVVGLGGRVFNSEGGPKYLNSPETEIFHKGRELYGLYQALKANRELVRVVVVEGYMDVVGLAQHDIRYAVATLGTALTEHHIKELTRHTSEIVFCFDGDRAGRQAAWRAMETSIGLLDDGFKFRFLFLPEGEDPDTLIRKVGKQEFEKLVENAMSLSDFLFESLSQKADIRREDGQARLVALMRPYIEKIPGNTLRAMMLNRLAALAQIDAAGLSSLVAKNVPGRLASRESPAKVTRDRMEMPTIARKAIALLLLNPSLADVAGPVERLRFIQVPGVALLQNILEFLRQSPNPNSTGSILEHWREQREGEYLARLVAEEWSVPEEGMEVEFKDALSRLERQGYEQQVDSLLLKARHNGLSDEEKELLNRLLRVGKAPVEENN